jgi:biopolymer transport protein ExbD
VRHAIVEFWVNCVWFVFVNFPVAGIDNIKVEPGTTASGSSAGNNNNSVTVTVASPGHGQAQQQQQQPQQITQAQLEQIQASGGQQIVTQHENADGTTSLSIAHVQTLQGHQLQLGNLNQVILKRIVPQGTTYTIAN